MWSLYKIKEAKMKTGPDDHAQIWILWGSLTNEGFQGLGEWNTELLLNFL